jgi:hypothetical protein
MFDFFEDLIEKLGIKLISDFSSKLLDFITDVKNNSNGSYNCGTVTLLVDSEGKPLLYKGE